MQKYLSILLLCCGWAAIPVGADWIGVDNADNDPYPVSGFLPGDNGGTGFTAWVVLDSGSPGSMYTQSAIDDGSYSWGIGGSYGLGRGLTNDLIHGSVTWLAVHDPDNTDFSGFNVKSSTNMGFGIDELIRFGFNPSVPGYTGEGVYVSTNAGADYTYFDCGWVDGEGDLIEYTLSWSPGSYTLSVSNHTESVFSQFSGSMSNGAVSMLGVGIEGAGLGETLAFDGLAAVPEPGAFVLFSIALVLLRFARRKI